MSQVYPAYMPQGAGGGQIISSGAGIGQLYTDRQHEWVIEYKIDPIKMGEMCEKFPALAKSWSQFKIVYDLCKSEENNG